jgi:hypothetical protein
VTRTVEQRMLAAESAGIELSLAELGEPAESGAELVRMATGPMAPLAATALARAARDDPDGQWAEPATAFTRSLAGQTSVLALTDTVDVLLDDGPIAGLVAPTLHTTLLQNIDQTLQYAPVLAARQLEGALRVALSGASSPYLVLDRLTRPIEDLAPEYVEKLPRLIGIALDVWSGQGLADPLKATLRALQDDEAADADATYELACQQMAVALRMVDSAEAIEGLRAAVDMFDEAVSLDEARDDAAAYRAVCQSVIAFAERDRPALAAASGALTAILSRRDAWHLNTHQPAWRSAARDAERQWLALVLDLRAADERLSEASWLETAAALGQLALVYDAERTVQPAPGLTALIRPAVENEVARNAVLLDQLARAVEADRRRDRPVLPSVADAILAAVREQRSRPPGSDGDRAAASGDGEDRIGLLAPSLRVLGTQVCHSLARLDDAALTDAEAVVSSLVSRNAVRITRCAGRQMLLSGHGTIGT